MPIPIRESAEGINLAPRVFSSTTVAASPAGATETTICTVTITGDIAAMAGVVLLGWAAFTVGTSGTAATLRIKQTNTGGTTIVNTGAVTGGIAAGALVEMDVNGIDTAPVLPGQVYVLTLTITAGAAASTVSSCNIIALVI